MSGGDGMGKGNDRQEEKKRDTIQYIINQTKQFKWEYGPVKTYYLDLEGVELPYDSRRFGHDSSSKPLPPIAESQMFGVVEWICITYSEKSAKIDEVMKIIATKWKYLGFPLFLNYFIIWSVISILITIIVVYDNDIPDLHPQRTSQFLMTIIFPIAAFLITVMTIVDVPGMLYYGLEYWGFIGKRIRGAAQMNKILKTISIILFYTLCSYKWLEYIENHKNTTSTITPTTDYSPAQESQYYAPIKRCEVLLVIIVWINMYYFLMGFDTTGK